MNNIMNRIITSYQASFAQLFKSENYIHNFDAHKKQ